MVSVHRRFPRDGNHGVHGVFVGLFGRVIPWCNGWRRFGWGCEARDRRHGRRRRLWRGWRSWRIDRFDGRCRGIRMA